MYTVNNGVCDKWEAKHGKSVYFEGFFTGKNKRYHPKGSPVVTELYLQKKLHRFRGYEGE